MKNLKKEFDNEKFVKVVNNLTIDKLLKEEDYEMDR